MKSRVHPTYKTKYRVTNWASYDRALVRRGDVTVWFSAAAIAAWEPAGVGRRGGQLRYSDLAIETALPIRLIFTLPLRQTEGFLTSLFGLMGLDLPAPDHTTLSRRGQHLKLTLRRVPRGEPMHLIVDSTGLSIVGEGEWAAAKHGGRGTRGWKKLHVAVNRSGVIIAEVLPEATLDDATTGIDLIAAVDGDMASVTADAAYDSIAFYAAAGARGAQVVVPPTKTARVSRRRPRSSARRSDDQDGEGHRTTAVEEGVWLPSAGSRGERLLQVQIDHRHWPSSAHARRAKGRGAARMQHPKSDDGPWRARVVRYR